MAGDGGDSDFVELLLEEVKTEGVQCPSVSMLNDFAKQGDYDTVASSLSFLCEMGVPDKAAQVLRRVMLKNKSDAGESGKGPDICDYAVAAKVLNRLVELGSLSEAQDLLKFSLVARDTPADSGRGKMLDCYDVSLMLGAMVPEGSAESAGRLLYALYSSEGGAEDAAASQTLVPFILGTLLDHAKADSAVELAKQLMYTTLEEIDAGAGEYDYGVLGWCLAQMVWYGRADWAARLCVDLERQRLDWYNAQELMGSVAGWGDASYSMTIENFMREARRGGGGAAGEQQQRPRG